MGSYNIAGTLSNISISAGEKIVFFPLLPTRFKYNKEADIVFYPQTMIVSNEGAAAYFSPRFLPIFGEYNDYGSIENIERDSNVEHIESYYGISIEDFIDCVAGCGLPSYVFKKMDDDKVKELKALSGMFELREVYEKMCNYGAEINGAFENLTLTSHVLESLGFVEQKEKTNDERFRKKYIHPLLEDFEIHSDGTFSKGHIIKENKDILLYSPKSLEDFTEKRGVGLPSIDKLRNTSLYAAKFDAELIRENEENKRLDEIIESEKEESKGVSEEKLNSALENIKEFFSLTKERNRDASLNRFYKMDYVFSDAFKKPFVDLLNFDRVMFSTNNFYFPAMNGEQDGNDKATKALSKTIIEAL